MHAAISERYGFLDMMLSRLSSIPLRRALILVSILGFFGVLVSIYTLNTTTIHSALRSPLQSWKSQYYRPALSRYYSAYSPSYFPPLKASGVKDDDLCANFPRYLLDRIQIVVKTGAGEPAKTQAHLRTVTSCISNLLVVSDLEDTVENHTVIDILADLPQSYTEHDPDFSYHEVQKDLRRKQGSVGNSAGGWKLDRFKFLPMVERAYKTSPNALWYVFLETDTYFFWDTLFRLLHQLDPHEKHYLGSETPGSYDRWFAYGGSGFVMSQGLMKPLLGSSSLELPPSVEFEQWVRDDCCGDAVLAYAVHNRTGTRVEGLYPIFAGDEPSFLRVDAERWCVPLLALHRVSPEMQQRLWEWERTRPYTDKPVLHSTYLGFTLSDLTSSGTKDNWDNYADQEQPKDNAGHDSPTNCAIACAADEKCMQWTWNDKVCRFGGAIQMGHEVKDRGKMVSGWDTRKMKRLGWTFGEKSVDACDTAKWMRPKVWDPRGFLSTMH